MYISIYMYAHSHTYIEKDRLPDRYGIAEP